jgi:hypothetical protein
MFEPKDPRPMDPPEAFGLPDGKEEWIAEKAIEIRCSIPKMKAALEWDGEQTGSGDIYDVLSVWMYADSHHGESLKDVAKTQLTGVLQELAERYAEYVLLPAHIEKMKKGDYCG